MSKVSSWAIWCRFGETQHIVRDCDGVPMLFDTRKRAKQFIDDNYGYIRKRSDLRAPPHNWRLPIVVKVELLIGG